MFLNQGIKAVRGEDSWDPCVPHNKPKQAPIFQEVIRKIVTCTHTVPYQGTRELTMKYYLTLTLTDILAIRFLHI